MYQSTIVVGHLGRDPEMRYTPSGVPVTNFSIATTRVWNDQSGERREKTTWFRVTAWRQLAETCNQYLSKGRLVLVEGDVEASAWMGQEGDARATLEITARTVRFLGGRDGGGDYSESQSAPRDEGEPIFEEDVPF